MKRSIIALSMGLFGATALATPALESEKQEIVPSLLVQSSKGYTYKNGKLTLRGVDPSTIVVADQPERLAGHAPTGEVIADWAAGRGSFKKNPPNADFSTFTREGTRNAVVELRNPKLKGDELTYDVKVLEGQLQPEGCESSMFIDIVGRPRTPMSASRQAYFR